MKAKLLVFFGIVALSLVISTVFLTKCRSGENGTIEDLANKKSPKVALPETVDTSSLPNKTQDSTNGGDQMTKPSMVSVKQEPEGLTSEGTPSKVFKEDKESPEGIVGSAANAIEKKDFAKFIAATNSESLPAEVKKKIKALLEAFQSVATRGATNGLKALRLQRIGDIIENRRLILDNENPLFA